MYPDQLQNWLDFGHWLLISPKGGVILTHWNGPNLEFSAIVWGIHERNAYVFWPPFEQTSFIPDLFLCNFWLNERIQFWGYQAQPVDLFGAILNQENETNFVFTTIISRMMGMDSHYHCMMMYSTWNPDDVFKSKVGKSISRYWTYASDILHWVLTGYIFLGIFLYQKIAVSVALLMWQAIDFRVGTQ